MWKVLLSVFSFLVGVIVYVMIADTTSSVARSNTLDTVFLNGGIGYLIALPIYFQVVKLLDKKFTEHKILLYPFVCMLVGLIPSSLIMLLWGGNFNLIFSDEFLNLFILYLATGFIFGSGYRFIQLFEKQKDKQN